LEIYRLLRKDDTLTAEAIAKSIGRDIRTVFRKIDSLKEKGLIKREGDTRNGHWAILPVPFDIDAAQKDERPKLRRKMRS
jgi:predicted transcriptional regulator